MNRRLERVNIAALRVALISTGVVATAYAIIAAVVVMVVTSNLTGQIDTRLTTSLSTFASGGEVRVPPASFDESSSPRFGPPLLVWAVDPSGNVATNTVPAAALPRGDRAITGPTTTTLGGVDVRLAGIAIEGGHLIVGQTLGSVSEARSTIIVTELVAGLGVVVFVFLGALFVGRRVGAPIELARQRQMEFTADASHELRTPLSVIEAQTSLALAQDRDAAWYRTAFQRVGSESGRIRRLVEDLLWLARVDTAEGRPPGEPVEVGVLARQAADRFAAVAESKGIRLTVAAGPGTLAVVGSPEWLDRLLGVLLDNACKYAPEGGAVAVWVGLDGGRVRLQVEDSGPGIPAEERPKIFDRFHRATRLGSGSGLGLAIADAVVRRTHGRWEVGASPLGGARMAVSWPRVLAGGGDPASEDAAAEGIPEPPGAAPSDPPGPTAPALTPSPRAPVGLSGSFPGAE